MHAAVSSRFASLAVVLATACGSSAEEPEPVPTDLPTVLPFELLRPADGKPPTGDEISAFTKKMTGLWKATGYFRWLAWNAHGLDASYDPDMPAFALYWQDVAASKSGDTVTFTHTGGSDNLEIRTSKVLAQAASGYLASGDPVMRELLIGYTKGMVALFQGMLWGGEDPPLETVMARSVLTHDHEYETGDGRKIGVAYGPAKVEQIDWNAHTVPNPDNPYFGSIWVRNMRSKDDVPHIYRVIPILMRVAQDADDEEVKAAAQAAVDHVHGFAADIVDSGYQIRTKEAGEVFVPPDQDLASFVKYDAVAPLGECNAKLTSALIGKGDAQGNDCGPGLGPIYEDLATAINYYNYQIVRYFHLAAITNALVRRNDAAARVLLDGLVERVDTMMSDEAHRLKHAEWDGDAAPTLLAAAASGLPLTGTEARFVQDVYARSADHYAAWSGWDPWDASVPDGAYEWQPPRSDAAGVFYVEPEEIAFLVEYCQSAWKNPAGVELVDCGVVLDPSRW